MNIIYVFGIDPNGKGNDEWVTTVLDATTNPWQVVARFNDARRSRDFTNNLPILPAEELERLARTLAPEEGELTDDELRAMMPVNLRADEKDALMFARVVLAAQLLRQPAPAAVPVAASEPLPEAPVMPIPAGQERDTCEKIVSDGERHHTQPEVP